MWYKPEKVKSEKKVENEELKTLIAAKLRVDKKAARKAGKKEGGAAPAAEEAK